MGVVLFATNRWSLARFSPLAVAGITVFYYVLCPSLSGFSVNPARSFSSAIFAWIWQGIWVYFAAPCLRMLAAAFLYIRCIGSRRVHSAKRFHVPASRRPPHLRFGQITRVPLFPERGST